MSRALPLSHRRRNQPRGITLLGTMIVLFFLLAITLLGTLGRTSTVSVNATAALQQVARQADSQTAHDLAETGVRITYSWMLEQETINNESLPFAPSEKGTDFYGASVESGYNVLRIAQAPESSESPDGRGTEGTIRVRIYPGQDPVTGQRVLAVEAIGSCGSATHTSRLVVRPKGFAEYGLFYDEPLDGFVWMSGMHVFSGPVHLNMRQPGTDTVDTSALHTIVWDSSNFLFTYPGTDYFTCSGAPSQIEWWCGLVTLQAPGIGDWPAIAAAGTPPLFNQPLIPFPTSTANLAASALGGATAPSSIGVLVPSASGTTCGGVYIQGNVTALSLTTSGTGEINQILTVEQTDGTTALRTVVTLDRLNSQTRVERYTTPSGGSEALTGSETYSGITNELVYVNGDVGDVASATGGLSGLVANSPSSTAISRLTIATPEDKRIQICGGVVYQCLATGPATNPSSNASVATPNCGILGLITGRYWIVDNDKGGNGIANVTVHAALLAMDSSGGTPSVGCTHYDTRPNGTYNHLGALIIRKDGPFGFFHYDSVTGALIDQFGFSRKRYYDLRLLELAPAFFPVANRTYKVLSFQSDVTPLS